MKKISKIFTCLILIIVFPFAQSYAYIDAVANPGAVYTIYNMDTWGKNDNNVTGPNFSKASVDTDNKIIKARAYASYGVPFVSPSKQVANAYLGSKVYFKMGQIPSVAEVRISFDGYYNGLIGALGVAAGRVIIKGKFLSGGGDSVTILDTAAGGIPSGQISGNFNKSFITNVYVDNKLYTPVLEVTVACGTSTSKVTGVCDNDFYESSRMIKLNWIKIEIIRSLGEGTVPGSGCVTSSSCLYPKPK